MGKKFGKLTITEHKPNTSVVYHPNLYYMCKCDCGNTRYVRLDYLLYGKITQCKECAKKNKIRKISPKKPKLPDTRTMEERLKTDTGIELEVDILLICLMLAPTINALIDPKCNIDGKHSLVISEIRKYLYSPVT